MSATTHHDRPTGSLDGRRAGAVAAMLVPLPVALISIIILTVGENLRQYGMPWLLALTALLMVGCFGAVHAVQRECSRRLGAVGFAMSAAALLVVSAFFSVIGLEDLVDNVFGTGRFLSSNGAVTAFGTLCGSLASLVLLPLGLLVFGIATVRAQRLPGLCRWLPLSVPAIVVSGVALGSATASEVVSLGWIWLVAAGCFRIGAVLLTVDEPSVHPSPGAWTPGRGTRVAVAGDHH